MMMQRRLLGAVLAGGQGRRFGSDKAAAHLGRRSLLNHAIAALSVHVAQVVVCGRTSDGSISLGDAPRPGLGPLGGLNAALRYASDNDYVAVLSTGCDMPLFPTALAEALIGDRAAVFAEQRLAGYWPSSLANALNRHLMTTDDLSMRAWLRKLCPIMVSLPTLDMPNINTTADLAAVRSSWSAER